MTPVCTGNPIKQVCSGNPINPAMVSGTFVVILKPPCLPAALHVLKKFLVRGVQAGRAQRKSARSLPGLPGTANHPAIIHVMDDIIHSMDEIILGNMTSAIIIQSLNFPLSVWSCYGQFLQLSSVRSDEPPGPQHVQPNVLASG